MKRKVAKKVNANMVTRVTRKEIAELQAIYLELVTKYELDVPELSDQAAIEVILESRTRFPGIGLLLGDALARKKDREILALLKGGG